ncbi:MAG: hypothetical protein Q8N56_02855 [bacterium]|nr:hypothetical protein [bacterium]
MNKKIISFVGLALLGLILLPGIALAETRFNMMVSDQQGLQLKNETQGTASWTDPISANAGDYVRFNVYYHCGTTNATLPAEKAQNTVVRLTFPTTEQTTINSGVQINSTSAASATDTGTINISSAQRLSFDGTAKWYRDNNQTVTDVAVIQGSGYVEVNLGEITCDVTNCYTNAGYVIFRGRLTSLAAPTVDIKANNSDGPISIDYNQSANLTWTSTNATSCYGTDTGWQGYKPLSGSESTGSLSSSRTYIIACTGSNGTATDRVTVNVNSSQTLYATLEALPNNGTAPLNGVDLRASATGTATGAINYKFDCTSDGTWEYTFYGIYDNPKTVVDACNYQNVGSYTAKVQVERGTALLAIATARVDVGQVVGGQDVSVIKYARNLSDNTAIATVTPADPSELIEFRVLVSSTGNVPAADLILKDTLPENMTYLGNLKIDGVAVVGNIATGLNLGTLNSQQTKTVTFEAIIASTDKFGFGQTDLVNMALVYNTGLAKTSSTTVRVNRSEVRGATDVPTGLFDNAKLAFIFSAGITLLLTYFLLFKFYLGNRAYVWGVSNVFQSAKNKVKNVLPKVPRERAENQLAKMIEKIRSNEQ